MKNAKSEPLKTILTIAMGFIFVFYATHLKSFILVSFIIGIAGLASDYLAVKIDWLWMKLTYILSLIVPNILLSVIFYVFLFPMALLSRLFTRNDNCIEKFCIVYLSSENSIFLYRQNNMNHLLNSAGLCNGLCTRKSAFETINDWAYGSVL